MAKDGGGTGGGTPTNPTGSPNDPGTQKGSPKGSKHDPGTSNPTDGSKAAGSVELIATISLAAIASAFAGILVGAARRGR